VYSAFTSATTRPTRSFARSGALFTVQRRKGPLGAMLGAQLCTDEVGIDDIIVSREAAVSQMQSGEIK